MWGPGEYNLRCWGHQREARFTKNWVLIRLVLPSCPLPLEAYRGYKSFDTLQGKLSSYPYKVRSESSVHMSGHFASWIDILCSVRRYSSDGGFEIWLIKCCLIESFVFKYISKAALSKVSLSFANVIAKWIKWSSLSAGGRDSSWKFSLTGLCLNLKYLSLVIHSWGVHKITIVQPSQSAVSFSLLCPGGKWNLAFK